MFSCNLDAARVAERRLLDNMADEESVSSARKRFSSTCFSEKRSNEK